MNYSRITELYGDSTYNLAPRKTFCGLPLGSDQSNSRAGQAAWLDALNDTTGLPSKREIQNAAISLDRTACLVLMDTDIEKKYKIGRSYQYESLKFGECIVNEKWS